jgi:Domain of unknown function (DUF6398)
MTRALQEPRVPSAVRPVFEEIVALTSAFCLRHLDAEYAELCVALTAKLAGKRPSPLVRGDRGIWAAGIVYTVGRVNFLDDPSNEPCLSTAELAKLSGVKPTTMASKGRLIMDTLNIGLMDPEFTRRDMIDKNPMVWFVQVDGLIVDARDLPVPFQVELCRRGLIPYVPDQTDRVHRPALTGSTVNAAVAKEALRTLMWLLPDRVAQHNAKICNSDCAHDPDHR